jgi:hypothetical protein
MQRICSAALLATFAIAYATIGCGEFRRGFESLLRYFLSSPGVTLPKSASSRRLSLNAAA